MDTKKIIIAAIIILIVAVAAFMFVSSNSQNTKIVVLSNSTLKNGDFVQVQLRDDYRNVFANETLDIKILDDSGWADKYSVATDENGTASVQLSTFENGNYTVHTNFNGTMFLKPSKSVDALVIDDGYGYY